MSISSSLSSLSTLSRGDSKIHTQDEEQKNNFTKDSSQVLFKNRSWQGPYSGTESAGAHLLTREEIPLPPKASKSNLESEEEIYIADSEPDKSIKAKKIGHYKNNKLLELRKKLSAFEDESHLSDSHSEDSHNSRKFGDYIINKLREKYRTEIEREVEKEREYHADTET